MINQKPPVIALADDDADDREIFTEVCADLGLDLKVLLFENGRTLMNALEHPSTDQPSIIFMDINMPVKNGFEALKNIRSNPDLKGICVIVYSTSISESDVKKAKELCADGFFQKPSDYSKLSRAIKQILDTDWKDPCAEFNDSNFIISI
ncbi:response regulator [Pareuzebyella sediminis]|uniref:response regulator n=1 Tax=Pareuzebyella sediminis TaxID=2607998 RepID=UPI0011EC2F91|nr:response regulator [Pareuzebyella sediminis]